VILTSFTLVIMDPPRGGYHGIDGVLEGRDHRSRTGRGGGAGYARASAARTDVRSTGVRRRNGKADSPGSQASSGSTAAARTAFAWRPGQGNNAVAAPLGMAEPPARRRFGDFAQAR